MASFLTVTPHDPVISRDGRPFGTGQRMGSLDWLYPSVLAGSLRTILGNIAQADFSKQETIDALKNVEISGPFPLWNDRIFLPAPKDIIVKEEEGKDGIKKRYAYAIQPTKIRDDEGCDMPFPKGVLCPAMLPILDEFKPAEIPAFWSVDKMIEWLKSPNGKCFLAPPGPQKQGKIKTIGEFLPNSQKDTRTHVRIDPKLGSTEDEMLFRTVGLDLSLKGRSQGIQLAVRVETEGALLGDKSLGALVAELDCFGTIGGERRLAHWMAEKPEKQANSAGMQSQASEGSQIGWNFSKKISESLDKQKNGNKRVRLVLATPAVFSQGWLPGWLEFNGESIESTPNKIIPQGLKLKLISACFDRWKPISGWSLERNSCGPKPIRRLVPAGSVYFFEILKGDASALAKLWLKSVCDDPQDRLDGFGLALWGIWDYADDETVVKEQE
jgi:CRISPR-associated protein Cmr3